MCRFDEGIRRVLSKWHWGTGVGGTRVHGKEVRSSHKLWYAKVCVSRDHVLGTQSPVCWWC